MSQSLKKVKILFVITQGEMGGAQRYVFDLATNLDTNRYEIMVAIGAENNDLRKLLEEKNIAVVALKHLRRNIHPLSELLAVLELKKLIKTYQPDIIHLSSSKAGVIGSLAAALAGNKNVVFTSHGFAFLEPHLFQTLYFWAEKFASLFRKKIITVSEFDRQAAIRSGLCAPGKLITIHNGIDSSDLKYRNIEISKPPGYVIGTIAHDYPTKDLNTMRRAFALVKIDHPDAELKIISNVANAAKLLPTFTIYVCSSVKEGFPYTILEAMAAGLPIVSTAVGGIPEAIENEKEGLLVPAKNPTAMAAAIKKLIADPQLAENLGTNAREKVKEFSLEKMISETELIYQLLSTNS